VSKIAVDLKENAVPIGSIQSHPANPRKGDIQGIAESLRVNGQYSPIIVDGQGNILAGNHTWRAAKFLGWDEIAVLQVDVDAQQAKRILLGDNRTSDLATYDRQSLIELIEAMKPDLEGSGWDERSLERLYQLEEDPEDIFSGEKGKTSKLGETTRKIHVGKNLLIVDADHFKEWFDGLGEKLVAVLTIRERLGLTDDPEPKPVKAGKRWTNISGQTPVHEALEGCVQVPTDSLTPHPENARQGDVGAISESLRVSGMYRPLIVQESSNLILKGNNTWQAVRSLGWETVPVIFLDVDDEQAKRVMLADNRLADKAGYYNTALAEVLMDLDSLDGTGFTPGDIDDILKDLPMERDPAAVINAPANVRRVASIKIGAIGISVCGKQYADWEQDLIAEGYMGKEERGLRIGELLQLDPSLFEVWASVADPTTGNKEFVK
jgi:ParB-like chromosome segregation protein Spo0J